MKSGRRAGQIPHPKALKQIGGVQLKFIYPSINCGEQLKSGHRAGQNPHPKFRQIDPSCGVQLKSVYKIVVHIEIRPIPTAEPDNFYIPKPSNGLVVYN